MQRILVVDDEPDIVEFIGYNLTREGYEVRSASDGEEAVEKAREFRPQLVLMDMLMPRMNGEEACRKIRGIEELKDTVIVFLSALGDERRQVRGYEAGADDYITKPVSMSILRSRVNAIMKRLPDVGQEIEVDTGKHTVKVNGHDVNLTRKEFDILQFLRSGERNFRSRSEIYEKVWGNDVIVGDRTLDVHIRSLRKKIGEDHILTKKGVGFRYKD